MKRKNEEKYGYKTLSSTLDHKNPYYSVYKDTIQYPDGQKKNYWVQNKDDFSIVIPLFENNTTLLVGQYRIPADFYSWEFPMGSSAGADPLTCAKKELSEETGYSAEEWKLIGSYFHAPGRAPTVVSVFIAKSIHEGTSHPESTEFLQKKKVSLDEVKNMIQSGTILDGPTLVAYHFLEKYLESHPE